MNPNTISYDLLDRVETGYRALHGDPSSRYVPGEGAPGQAMVINYAPGAAEVLTRSPVAGPMGKVLRELMDLAGLSTHDRYDDGTDSAPTAGANCWLTNVMKFRPSGSKKHADAVAAIRKVRPLLRAEWIAVGMPCLIITIGSMPLYAVAGSITDIVPAAKPYPVTSRKGLPLILWPMINPIYAVQEPGLQPIIEDDWERLGRWRNANY